MIDKNKTLSEETVNKLDELIQDISQRINKLANYIKNLDSKLASAIPAPYAQRETYINKQAE